MWFLQYIHYCTKKNYYQLKHNVELGGKGDWHLGQLSQHMKSDHDCILILHFVNSSIGQSQLCVIRITRWKETHEQFFNFFLKLNKITTEIGVWPFTERYIILWMLYKHVYYTKKSSTNRNKLGCIESWLLYIFL